MPLYFAYGINMDIADMARRAPRSRPLGPAILKRHRFIIMREGYASVVRDPRANVHGLLWDLALADLAPLDRFEGLDRGLYVKLGQPVATASGAKRALVYVGASAEPGRPKPGYLDQVLRAAADIGLPETYRREIAAWSGEPQPRPEGPVASVTPRFSRPG
jgi:gamma-glutamylcyclotransferase (GGCT)/AIG2-like uncharacterized protein YtfP